MGQYSMGRRRVYSRETQDCVPLLSGTVITYGGHDRSPVKEVKKPRTRSGVLGLFRYATPSDIVLIAVGMTFSIVNGSALPVLGLVFGQMTNTFMIAITHGISNSSDTLDSESDFNISHSNFTNFTNQSDSIPLTPDMFLRSMSKYPLYYMYIGVAALTSSFFQNLCWEMSCERQVYRLRKLYFSQVLRQDIAWYDKNQQGDLNSKLSDDIERIREGIGVKFSLVVQYCATFICGLLVGLYADWRLTCVLLIAGPFVIAAAAYMALSTASSAEREQLKYSFAGAVAEEVLNSIKTVAAFGGERREIDRYDKALDEGRKQAMKKYLMMSIGLFFVSFTLYATYGLAFWAGAGFVASGLSTAGSVITVFFSVMMGAFSLGGILPFISSVSGAIGSARNIFAIIDRVPTIDPYSTFGKVLDKMSGNITFENVFFSYPTRTDVKILKGLNLKILSGQTVAVVGSSGAGKSTLVNLIMRFYDVQEGKVLIDGVNVKNLNLKWLRDNIGIVSQEPVLFGVSILENIKYGKDKVTLEEVITAAMLANAHSFIKQLPNGYETILGDRGAQLSGGQKQRIAIARALVRRPKILLLDEATSALDSQSEGVVQEALENASKGRTTIIIAHRLSTIRNANVICVMKDGQVVETGTHDQLMARKSTYFKLVTTEAKETKEGESAQVAISRERLKSMTDSTYSLNESDKSEEEHDDFDGDKSSVLLRLLKLNMKEWHFLLLGLIAAAVSGAIQPIFAFFYGEIFSTFSLVGEDLQYKRTFWSCMFVLLGIVSGIAYWIWVITMAASAEHLVARIRLQAMANILRQELAWFDNKQFSVGKLITRLTRDAPIIKCVAGMRIAQATGACTTLIVALLIAFIYGWKLALLLLVIIPIIIYAGYQQVHQIRKFAYRDMESLDNAGKVASECIQNLKTVQSIGREAKFRDVYIDYLKVPHKENKKQAYIFAALFAICQAVVYFLYSGAFKYGSYLIAIGDMGPSDVFRVFFALAFSAVAIGQGAAYLQDYAKGKTSARIMFFLMDKTSDLDPLSADGLKLDVKGKITFNSICFSYPSRKNVQILNGFDLRIDPGQTVALVGESGCGKSTAIALLERFYRPDRGVIQIDDMNIESFNVSCFRSQIGIVTQEPVLFNSTIKENITYGTIASGVVPTDQEVIDAARAANIHDFITTLPQGYDTPCGERGTQLSGGQKQRLAIARALIRNPRILLLDEATSALDNENEKIVQEALDRARQGRTCIVVAHRLSTIQNADKIAVVHKGRIVELGTHHDLIERQGHYYRLVKRQQL